MPAKRAVSAIALGFFLLAAAHALTVRPFFPADETSHTAYALVLADGALPTLDTPVPTDQIEGMPTNLPSRLRVYTANHPPLYYITVAPVLWLGVQLDQASTGFFVARLVSAGLTAVGILGVASLARTLVPERRDVEVIAAALACGYPGFVHLAGLVHNDGFAFALTAWTLAVSARVVLHDRSPRLLAVLALLAAASATTRATGIGVAAIAVGAAGLSPLVSGGASLRGAVISGAKRSAVVASAAVVMSGWFWLRNARDYGDLAGSSENLERFGFTPRSGSTIDRIADPDFIESLYRTLWGRFAGGRDMAEGWWFLPAMALGLAIVVGSGVVMFRLGRRRRWSRVGAARLGIVAVLVAWIFALWTFVASYYMAGGGLHARYLFPGLPAAAVLGAIALTGLGRSRAWLAGLIFGAFAALNIVWLTRFLRDVGRRTREEPLLDAGSAWRQALDYNGIAGGPWVALGLCLTLAAVTAVVVRAGRTIDSTDSADMVSGSSTQVAPHTEPHR